MTDIEDGTDTKVAFLTNHDPETVLDELPGIVFPVKMQLHYPLSRESDVTDGTYSTPEYPVDIHTPETPYIPETTVYFDNPAIRPPTGTKPWPVAEFVERVTEQVSYVEGNGNNAETTLQLLSLTVAEIPQHYLTTDAETGAPAAKPDLYKQNGEITIAQFKRDASFSATDVRAELEDALPGETRTPTRLTKLVTATAKPARFGQGTTANAGQARYFTASEAEKNNDLSLTPAVYQPRKLGGEEARPLAPFIDELDSFLPGLTRQTDLVATARFAGQEREETTFHAEEVFH